MPRIQVVDPFVKVGRTRDGVPQNREFWETAATSRVRSDEPEGETTETFLHSDDANPEIGPQGTHDQAGNDRGAARKCCLHRPEFGFCQGGIQGKGGKQNSNF